MYIRGVQKNTNAQDVTGLNVYVKSLYVQGGLTFGGALYRNQRWEPVISRDNDITRQMGTDRSIQIIARSRSLISQGRRELFRHILTSLTLEIDFRFSVWLVDVISILPILLWLFLVNWDGRQPLVWTLKGWRLAFRFFFSRVNCSLLLQCHGTSLFRGTFGLFQSAGVALKFLEATLGNCRACVYCGIYESEEPLCVS